MGKKNKPQTVLGVLQHHLLQTLLCRRLPFDQVRLPNLPGELDPRPRSISIRHLDCGSCNGCELELNALTNPVYDMAQYGIHFEASPRHADILAMTGPFTRNLEEAVRLTLEAMPVPRVIAIGNCAIDKGIFKGSYAVIEPPADITKVINPKFCVPGCPPTPEDILKVLLRFPHTLAA